MFIYHEVGVAMKAIRVARDGLTPAKLALLIGTTTKRIRMCEKGSIIFNNQGWLDWCCIMALEQWRQPGETVTLTEDERTKAKQFHDMIGEAMQRDIERKKKREQRKQNPPIPPRSKAKTDKQRPRSLAKNVGKNV